MQESFHNTHNRWLSQLRSNISKDRESLLSPSPQAAGSIIGQLSLARSLSYTEPKPASTNPTGPSAILWRSIAQLQSFHALVTSPEKERKKEKSNYVCPHHIVSFSGIHTNTFHLPWCDFYFACDAHYVLGEQHPHGTQQSST